MHIKLITIGKTDNNSLQELITIYKNRLKHYINFKIEVIPDIKNTKHLSVEQQKTQEGKLILKQLKPNDFVILLDENGKEYSSVEFSNYLQKHLNSGIKQLVFIIGGPYGFSKDIYSIVKGKLALSRLTFSHQMVRLFFVEQLYRAFTILKNESYHHQ